MSIDTQNTSSVQVITVTDESFASTVLHAPQLTVVDFTADWCPPCRALEPVYNRLSSEFAGKVRFTRMDTDENIETGARYGIQAAPTLIFFKDGKEVERLVGPHPGRLRSHIERILVEAQSA